MAAFNKVNVFVENLAHGIHDFSGDTITDTLKIVLTNVAPDAADAVYADLTEISVEGNADGYNTGGMDVTIASSGQTGGTYKLVLSDLTITCAASTVGDVIGPFRYFVLMDDTPAAPAKPLVGWWDYGSSITLNDGESITIDFSATDGVIQIA